MRHRIEIDGLRGIAILAVLLYHLDVLARGGYTGVDIFFVISGYLITSLIVKDLQQGSFTLLGFWERRARRIAPALLMVLVVTICAGAAILLPRDFQLLCYSSGWQAVSAANIYFYRHTGYFHPNAEDQPLLHTWSLSLEEQFYVVAPLALWSVCCLSKRRMQPMNIALICACVAISFALGLYLLSGRETAAFYLLPGRAWELLVGSLVAVIPPTRLERNLREVLSWVCAALLFLPIWAYSNETRFPGCAALAPSVGTAGVIWLTQKGSTESDPVSLVRVLSFRPLVFFGLISYSLYLWHWPIFVFYRYLQFGAIGAGERLMLGVAATTVAVLSWKYIESPFRTRRLFAKRTGMIVSSILGLAAVLALSGLVAYRKGFPNRFSKEVVAASQAATDSAFLNSVSASAFEKHELPRIGSDSMLAAPWALVIGDSHGMAFIPAMDAYLRKSDLSGIQATRSATAPLLEFSYSGDTREGAEFVEAAYQFARSNAVHNVFLVAYWEHYRQRSPGGIAEVARALTTTITALRRAGKTVYLVLDVPAHPYKIPHLVAMARRRGVDYGAYLTRRPMSPAPDDTREVLGTAGRKAGAVVLDPAPLFAMGEVDHYIVETSGVILYRDSHHLTASGSRLVLEPWLESVLGPVQDGAHAQATGRRVGEERGGTVDEHFTGL